MEQELASIAKYIITTIGNSVHPYYRNLPENFRYPAVYFPVPDITTDSDTFSTYRSDYVWCVTFFHNSKQEAYELALTALTAIKRDRNLVPLLASTGAQVGKRLLRLNDPSLRCTSENSAMLVISLAVRKNYKDTSGSKVATFNVSKYLK